MSKPSSSFAPSAVQAGKREGGTAEDAEVAESLRIIPVTPRLAREDPVLLWGLEGHPTMPMPEVLD